MRLGMGIFAAAALVTIATTGCGAGCQECANEAEKLCTCADGITGVQTCTDGEFGACSCTEPPPPAFCGDGVCAAGERRTCTADCGSVCGDGICAFTESPATCPLDCTTGCGDRFCDPSESPMTCPEDCGAGFCGDGICDVDESIATCSVDCSSGCDFTTTFEAPVSDAMQEAGEPAMAVDTATRIFYVAWIGTDSTTMLPYAFLASIDPIGPVATRALAMGTPASGISVATSGERVATAWIDAGGQVTLTITTGLATDLLPPTPVAAGGLHGTALVTDELGRFVLAWAAMDGIHVARFSSDGVRDGPDTVIATNPIGAPSLAGTALVGIAWLATDGMGAPRLEMATLDPMGTLQLDGGLFAEAQPLATSRPALAWTDLAFLVAWDQLDGIGYAVVDAAMLTFSTPIQNLAAGSADTGPALALATEDLTLAWSGSFVEGEEDVLLARIQRSGVLRGSIFALADAASPQTTPVVAWSGVEIGVAWNDRRDGYGAVWFTAVGLCE